MQNEIMIIGTEPPCPRCDYLSRMVQDIVEEMQLEVPVRHIAYTTKEALQVAAESGLLPGTAKDVAKKIAVRVDWDRVHQLIEETPEGSNQSSCCGSAAQKWSPALDEALRSCEERAIDAGIMMTPVLVVNGNKVHQGCIPDRVQVVAWIRKAFDVASDTGAGQNVVEVLGVGCEKCDQLYARVASVMAEMGVAETVILKKRSDIGYFAEKGVVMTPGLVINGQVVSMGRLPDPEQLSHDLSRYLGLNKSEE